MSSIQDIPQGIDGDTGNEGTYGENDDVQLADSTGGRSGREVVASEQIHYKPESKGGEIVTLVPANMFKPLQDALKRLASQHGSVDEIVIISAAVFFGLLFS